MVGKFSDGQSENFPTDGRKIFGRTVVKFKIFGRTVGKFADGRSENFRTDGRKIFRRTVATFSDGRTKIFLDRTDRIV